MTVAIKDLPQSLLDRVQHCTALESTLGRLGNQLIRLQDKEAGPAYLKIGSSVAGQDLVDEAGRLDWIGGRLPVPKVLYRGK